MDSYEVKIQVGVNSCGASKPVYKHVCDSSHLFLSLVLVSFSHLPLCVASSLSSGQHHHPAHPSPCVHFALSFLLSPPPHILLCPSETPTPIFQWDGCHSILAVVQHFGMHSIPCRTAALNLVGCFPWLRLNAMFELAGQKILITFLKVIS